MKKPTTKICAVREVNSRNGGMNNAYEETLEVVNIASGKIYSGKNNGKNIKRRVEVKQRVEKTREFGVERSLVIDVDGVTLELFVADEKLVLTVDASGYEKMLQYDRMIFSKK